MRLLLLVGLVFVSASSQAETCRVRFLDQDGRSFLGRVDSNVAYGEMNELTYKYAYMIDMIKVRRKKEVLDIELYNIENKEPVSVHCLPGDVLDSKDVIVGASVVCPAFPDKIVIECNLKDQQVAFEDYIRFRSK